MTRADYDIPHNDVYAMLRTLHIEGSGNDYSPTHCTLSRFCRRGWGGTTGTRLAAWPKYFQKRFDELSDSLCASLLSFGGLCSFTSFHFSFMWPQSGGEATTDAVAGLGQRQGRRGRVFSGLLL